ncbi:MAG: hypothetical protein ACREMN_12325, partial [Gemmatimonadales bacterium]
ALASLTASGPALAPAPDAADPALHVTVRLRLVELYLEAGRLPDAEDEARRAEEVAIATQASRSLARVYVLMGRMRERQRDENGFVFFEQAIELCRGPHPDARLEADVYRAYGQFRVALGDLHEAGACLARARDLLVPFGDEVALERVEQDLSLIDSSHSPRP